jgi:hypothetical protein
MTRWVELTLHGGKRISVAVDRIVAVEEHPQGALLFMPARGPTQVQQYYDMVLKDILQNDEVSDADAAREIGKFPGRKRGP